MTAVAPRRPTPEVAARERRLVGALALASFVEWLGAGSVLPLLPLFLRRHGSSDALVGLTMAAFFAAAFVVQYPAGRLSDRIGRRPLQLAGLCVYAGASVAFAFAASPLAAVAWRGLQGMGSGVVDVASAAVIGERVSPHWRGRAYGAFYGARTAGLAVGPLVGSLLGAGSMRIVFFAAAAASLLAMAPIRVVVPRGAGRAAPRGAAAPLRVGLQRSVVGVASCAVAGGLATGMYEACWSLLLHLRGAASWQIGLSFTLFALPFAVLSVPAGWLSDRLDRRYLAAAALVSSAGFAAVYPFLASRALLVGLGAAEAVGVAISYPAISAQLVHSVEPRVLGRAQGILSSSQTAATALSASVSGTLFGLAPFLPFVAVAAAMLVIAAALPLWWRGVPGRLVPARAAPAPVARWHCAPETGAEPPG